MAADGSGSAADQHDVTGPQTLLPEHHGQSGLSARRRLSAFAVVVIVALSITTFKFWRDAQGPVTIEVIRGETENVAIDGVFVSLADVPEEDVLHVIGTGHPWQGIDGAWHDSGQPECLPPDSFGASVEIGIILDANHDHPYYSSEPVAWVRCLTLPTDIRDSSAEPLPLDRAYQRARDRER